MFKNLEKIIAAAFMVGAIAATQIPSRCEAKDFFFSKRYPVKLESLRGYIGELLETFVTLEAEGETRADFYELKVGIYTEDYDKEKFSPTNFFRIDPNRSSFYILFHEKKDITAEIWERGCALDYTKTTKNGVSCTMRGLRPYEDASAAKAAQNATAFFTDRGIEAVASLGLGFYLPFVGKIGRTAMNKMVGGMNDFSNQRTNEMLWLMAREFEERKAPNHVLNESPKEIYAKEYDLPFNFDKETEVLLMFNVGINYQKLPDIYEVGKLENVLLTINLNRPLKVIDDEVAKKAMGENAAWILIGENDPWIHNLTYFMGEREKVINRELVVTKEEAFISKYHNIDDGPRVEKIVAALGPGNHSREDHEKKIAESFLIFPFASDDTKPLFRFDTISVNYSPGPKDFVMYIDDFDNNSKPDVFVSSNLLYRHTHDKNGNFVPKHSTNRMSKLYLNYGYEFREIIIGDVSSYDDNFYTYPKGVLEGIEKGIKQDDSSIIKDAIKDIVMDKKEKEYRRCPRLRN